MSQDAKRFSWGHAKELFWDVLKHAGALLILALLTIVGGYIWRLVSGLAVPWKEARYVVAGLSALLAPTATVYFFREALEQLRWPHLTVIRGLWNTAFEKLGKTNTEVAKVRQWGPSVWGTIYYAQSEKTYKFRGSLYQNVLVATYWCSSERVLDVGAFTLITNPNRDGMQGKHSWTDSLNLQAQGGDYNWTLHEKRRSLALKVVDYFRGR